jgi:hypothetical protein
MLVSALLALLAAVQTGHCEGITKTADLSFGAMVPYTGGTVTVTPFGVRNATGGVLLVSGFAGSIHAATFTVTGSPNATYSIGLPEDGTVTLRDGADHSMALDTFTSVPAGSGTVSGASPGTQTLKVGATLHVGASQAAGQYTGSYEIIVAFN